jgi:D-alanyl-D-alanine carboxypeptidase/D-alanyl-D-alanine-endopeptidase (penicillin-binding protein 4)
MRPFIHIILLTIILCGCAPSIRTTTERDPLVQLRNDINSILADSLFVPVHASIKIVSLNNGQVLYDRESKALMNPASNMKLLTSATALAVLDTGYQFNTVAYSDGYISDSILIGDLFLKGFGDPGLTTADLDSLSSIIRASGIIRIAGNIVADDSYFDDEYWGSGWMWDDDLDPDAPYISSLSINDNCISVSIERTPQDSVDVSIFPALPAHFISVINKIGILADSTQNAPTFRRLDADRRNVIVAEGELERFGPSIVRKISLRFPHLYVAQLFKEALLRRNVSVDGEVAEGITPLGSREIARSSHPIERIICRMNKISDNLSAENILKILGATAGGIPGTSKKGLAAVKNFLSGAGIDTSQIFIADGSGVSRYDLLSADQLTRLLAGVYERPRIFPVFYNSLPIAGTDGTLSGRMINTPAEANLRAKTGTLNGVSCLSGYVRTRDAEMLAFSMMMQNFLSSPEACRRAQDRIGILMANFSRKIKTK